MRLDHLLLSPETAARLRGAGVDRAVRGLANASDHAPVLIELGGVPRGSAGLGGHDAISG